jgi:hypothetical protein
MYVPSQILQVTFWSDKSGASLRTACFSCGWDSLRVELGVKRSGTTAMGANCTFGVKTAVTTGKYFIGGVPRFDYSELHDTDEVNLDPMAVPSGTEKRP